MNDTNPASGPAASYRVLARKYRPSTFADLIGQEAMVRTISNAFETGRIPQAWILTGVRGVGKTTTARILARALNYELPDGSVTGPTIHMPVLGVHCQAIVESRHLDVIEMDAASHNSVEDVRTINEAIRYAPVSARYKVYILDEVHMLSGSAFNALLKTLEEPPPHAKFVFATTEIRKVPITVLSRCQRFDLRRLDAALLVKHLQNIAEQETIKAEPTALALIARVAEGSVRDALSLLDQAIAHAAGPVRAEDVRQMLGLADRARIIDLFGALMGAELPSALTELRDQYDKGADPATVLGDLAEFTHFVTRVKAAPALAEDVSLTEQERTRGRDFAAKLSMRVLARTWQMLLKGIEEVQEAGRPLASAEMVLVRIAYAADLPTPDEAIRLLADSSGGNGAGSTVAAQAPARPEPQLRSEGSRGAMRAALAPAKVPIQVPGEVPAADVDATPSHQSTAVASFTALVALAGEKRDLAIKSSLERNVRLVRFEDGRIEIALEENAPKSLVGELSKKLADWTGRRWMVIVSSEPGMPSIYAQEQARKDELKDGVRDDPLVQAVLARFPGAEIVGVRAPAELEEPPIEPATDPGAADDQL